MDKQAPDTDKGRDKVQDQTRLYLNIILEYILCKCFSSHI